MVLERSRKADPEIAWTDPADIASLFPDIEDFLKRL
jgi:hypothetical protein